MPLPSFGSAEDSRFRVGDLGVGALESTGVGGVTVVSGGFDPALGGVCGRSLIFREGRPGLGIFGRSDGSVFTPVSKGEGAGLLV